MSNLGEQVARNAQRIAERRTEIDELANRHAGAMPRSYQEHLIRLERERDKCISKAEQYPGNSFYREAVGYANCTLAGYRLARLLTLRELEVRCERY